NLEGRLAGAWVGELEKCLRSCTARAPKKTLEVDLTNTESVDMAGKYLLALMYQSGVKITARNPYMNAVAEEILRIGARSEPRSVDMPTGGNR
ncbi:MAG: hypothetical protein LC114_10985, partial [Bryobacterales bacterium]|nr:hypothetical protein [Bryobacterales bacterium]